MSLDDLAEAVTNGNTEVVLRLTKELLKKRFNPKDIVKDGLTKGMTNLGYLWDKGDVFLIDVLIAVDAYNQAFKNVQPYLKEEKREVLGTVVIGTVAGDIHDIGKNIVATMLECVGFNVINLGEDVSAEKFCNALVQHRPNIMAMSCLISTSLSAMEEVIIETERRGLRDSVKIMVGGPPVNLDFVKKIGADYTASDAFMAAQIAKEAMKIK